jgi:Flp pilus assembly secretin CpaC
MNLPILGALFRSRDYQRKETELMIMVTPFIAKPMNPDQVARPDDGFVEAHDAQTVLLGRLNRLYGVAGAARQGAVQGPVRLHHGLRADRSMTQTTWRRFSAPSPLPPSPWAPAPRTGS